MSNQKQKFYITTAIDYVNDKPHIGHALEKIQADVLARYHRKRGDEVFFLTGTDEHGVKNVRAAEAARKTPQELTEENSDKFRRLKEALNLSWDDFIRTSDEKRHWPGAQKLWMKLYESGDLYKKVYRGLYCVGHEAFVTEKDLAGGECKDHKKKPEIVEEENWFFRLSKYSKEIESGISNKELKIIPETRKNEILSFIHQGLEDVSFSRLSKDLSWGIPVPNDPEHTMYVWCDALSNYISAIGYGGTQNIDISKFQTLWPADLHVIGKDILRFHAAIWPGMLLSAGLSLPKAIFVHGFITVDGEKMSKTIGNVIDPTELVEKYGTDATRYFLLREIPSYDDGDFSYKKFEERYNGDLANGLGNLVARVATLGGKLEQIADFENKADRSVIKKVNEVMSEYEKSIEEIRLNEALARIWELISFADSFVNEKKIWLVKEEQELGKSLSSASYLIIKISELLRPFLPKTAGEIEKQFIVDGSSIKIKKGESLFPRKDI